MNITEFTRGWAETENLNFKFYPSIDSTNSECKRTAFKDQNDFFLCFADHQTGGRGRFERSWTDHGFGSYLLSSWSFKVSTAVHPLITARLGLGIVTQVSKFFPVKKLALKAPNDLYIGLKKVGGILTESVNQGDQHRLIIGLGLNVLDNPSEQATSTSLKDAGAQIDVQKWFYFLNGLKTELERIAGSVSQSSLSAGERAELLKHLNQFEGLKAPYTEITEAGELVSSLGKTTWMDL